MDITKTATDAPEMAPISAGAIGQDKNTPLRKLEHELQREDRRLVILDDTFIFTD